MTSDDVLGRIMNHEINIQEANNIKNFYKGISTSKKQDIAVKATNKSKKKKAIIESSSEEEEEEDEDDKEYDEVMTLFTKKFNKYIKKRKPYKGDRKVKSRSRRVCYNYSKNDHFIAQCSHERKENNDKKQKFDKGYKKDNKYNNKKPYGNHSHQGQSFIKQVSLPQAIKAHMSHGKGR
jgi:hypothetical protein